MTTLDKQASKKMRLEILRMYKDDDISQSEIARFLGVSRQYVHQIVKCGKGYSHKAGYDYALSGD